MAGYFLEQLVIFDRTCNQGFVEAGDGFFVSFQMTAANAFLEPSGGVGARFQDTIVAFHRLRKSV
jgi:hypothetical protein